MNFKINSRPLKLKNDNFKTRDFSPLIERVLPGVHYMTNLGIRDDVNIKMSILGLF